MNRKERRKLKIPLEPERFLKLRILELYIQAFGDKKNLR